MISNLTSISVIKYGIVGVLGVGVDFLFTWFFKEKIKVNKYVANSIGFSAAVINNFFLNRYWTFNTTDESFSEQFLKFVLVAIIGLLINNALLFLLSKYVKYNFYVLKFIIIGLVFLWNFFMNSLYTFH